MKKFFALALIVTLAAAAVTGCGSDNGNTSGNKSDSGDKPELVWLTIGPGEAPAWEGISEPILEEYNSSDAPATVKGEFYSTIDLYDVIEVKVASGSADYDVISVDVPLVTSYAYRNMILPMDQYFTDEEKNQFIESTVTAGSYNGKFYAPPMSTSAQMLWYNTALLEEAGVTLPENDVNHRLTWEQVADIAKQVQDKLDPDRTQGIFGLDFQQVSRVYQMNALPNSLGGKNIGDDGLTVEGVINDDAWVEACTWYQNLVKDGIASQGITGDEMSDYFYSGKLVFMMGGTWTASQADTKGMTTYGVCPSPAFEGHEDETATATGCWHYGINSASEHPDEAADFIRYMSLGKGNDDFVVANSDVSPKVSVLDSIVNDEDAPSYLKIAAEEANTTAVPRALTPGFNEYQTILNNTWEDIRNGADVKTSLDTAAAQLTESMKQYQ